MATDFSKLTAAQLKAECESRSLETKGKKADLVARLLAALPPAAAAAAGNAPSAMKVDDPEDPNMLKVPDLKAELTALGESTAGNKAALVARLVAARTAGTMGAPKRPAAPDAAAAADPAPGDGSPLLAAAAALANISSAGPTDTRIISGAAPAAARAPPARQQK